MGDCVNRDECALGEHNCPTEANGVCIDTHPSENGFFCDCIDGYTFFPGQYQIIETELLILSIGSPKGECIDDDECRTFTCPTNAACNNLVPGFECACKLGFQQNGLLPPGNVFGAFQCSILAAKQSRFQMMVPKVLEQYLMEHAIQSTSVKMHN